MARKEKNQDMLGKASRKASNFMQEMGSELGLMEEREASKSVTARTAKRS